MNIHQALRELGVEENTLLPEEKTTLDRDGYVVMKDFLSREQIEVLRNVLARLSQEESENAGREFQQEAGTERFSDLINKDAAFDICYTHPRILAAVAHVLGDFKFSSLNARTALPGQGMQGLHTDGPAAFHGYLYCNSIWLLDDFVPDNGATRVVAGTHRSGKMPDDVMSDTTQPHPDEKLLLAPVGTVVVFNSHTWHGGTLNATNRPRRALHSYFCRRDQPQQIDQKAFVRPETLNRISVAARFLLDV